VPTSGEAEHDCLTDEEWLLPGLLRMLAVTGLVLLYREKRSVRARKRLRREMGMRFRKAA
jgi:hypothetical protein